LGYKQQRGLWPLERAICMFMGAPAGADTPSDLHALLVAAVGREPVISAQ
jgi:hypothetical protein